jgi:hypothetical protein
MKITIEVFLAAVVLAACPLAHGQDNNTSASPSVPAAKSVRTSRGSYAATSEACKKLVNGKKFADAQESCASAIKHAEVLPAKQWRERSAAYSMRGQAELGVADADDAAQDFKRAIEIDGKNLKPEDLALAIDYANLALAQFQLGDLENLNFSDQSFQKATDAIEIDTLNDPAKRDDYQRALKGILLNYAKVKRALGQGFLARALEQQANSIRER